MKEKLAQQQELVNNALMTEQQKNQRIVEEVLNSKDYEHERKVKELEAKLLAELPKCPLHPKNIF